MPDIYDWERYIFASSAADKREENDKIISENANLSTEKAPKYTIQDVIFSDETRLAKILIIKTTCYRKIERYITREYVHYPIYSSWQSREKQIQKTLLLNNETLENLQQNPDVLISSFASDIIMALKRPDLIPSWMRRQQIEKDFSKKKEGFARRKLNSINQCVGVCDDLSLAITDLRKGIDSLRASIKKETIERQEIIQKEEDCKKRPPLWLILITFGFVLIFHSKYQQDNLFKKEVEIKNNIDSQENQCVQYSKSISTTEDNRLKHQTENKNRIDSINQEEAEAAKQYKKDLASIVVLPISVAKDCSFKPLSDFPGYKEEKIIGCYVIRNKYNGKCYVGQSKDVLKRLSQHFSGTTPKNPIFTEDYWTAKQEDRSAMFEVKIIPLQTKDELDSYEKKLIEEYHAFDTGYNGTSGND